MHYAERVSRRDDNSIEYWQDFVSTFYAAGSIARDDVVMKLALWNAQYGENRTFELNATLLARYYKIIFDSGIKDLVLLMENPKEYFSLGMMLVDCPRASMVYTFDNDVQVVSRGHLRVTFTSQGTIQLWEFHTKQHTEMLPRAMVEALMRQAEGGAPMTLPPSPVNEFGISIKMMRCLEVRAGCVRLLVCRLTLTHGGAADRRGRQSYERTDDF